MEVMQTHLLSASLQMELECSRCMFKPFLHYSIWIGIAISKPVFHIGKTGGGLQGILHDFLDAFVYFNRRNSYSAIKKQAAAYLFKVTGNIRIKEACVEKDLKNDMKIFRES